MRTNRLTDDELISFAFAHRKVLEDLHTDLVLRCLRYGHIEFYFQDGLYASRQSILVERVQNDS